MTQSEEKSIAAITKLEKEHIDYDIKNSGVHLIVTDFQGDIIDFWQTTGKWIPRINKEAKNSGLNNLIRYIKNKG